MSIELGIVRFRESESMKQIREMYERLTPIREKQEQIKNLMKSHSGFESLNEVYQRMYGTIGNTFFNNTIPAYLAISRMGLAGMKEDRMNLENFTGSRVFEWKRENEWVEPEIIPTNDINQKNSNEFNLDKKIKISLTCSQFEEFEAEFKEHFNPEQHSDLHILLKGGNIKNKLIFNDNQNKLIELFRRLYYNDFVFDTKTGLAKWLCANFKFRIKHSGEIRNLKHYSVWEILSKGRGEARRQIRICTFNWLPYKKQDSLAIKAGN